MSSTSRVARRRWIVSGAVVVAALLVVAFVALGGGGSTGPTGVGPTESTGGGPPPSNGGPPASTGPGDPSAGNRPPAPQGAGGPVAAPVKGALFGIYRDPSSNGKTFSVADRMASLEELEGVLGRRFDIDHQFYRWGDDLPAPYLRWTAEQGRTPFISLNALRRDGSHRQWADIASGADDDYLRQLAAGLRSWGVPSLFSFHHEPENEICPGDNPTGCDRATYYGTREDYRAAWRHIVETFRAAGVTNLSYVWITTGYRFTDPADYRYGPKVYPGNDLIDWIASDPYNLPTPGGKVDLSKWQDLAAIIEPWYRWGETTGKPLMLGEFGSLEDPDQPGRRPAWFATARADLQRRFPAVKALNYYDVYRPDEPGSDWRLLGRNPAAVAEYRAWALDPYFRTR